MAVERDPAGPSGDRFDRRFTRFRPRLLDTLGGYDRHRLLADVGAGITVGVVALPLDLWSEVMLGDIVPVAGRGHHEPVRHRQTGLDQPDQTGRLATDLGRLRHRFGKRPYGSGPSQWHGPIQLPVMP